MTINTSASSDGRLPDKGDWIAQKFFSPTELRLSPEKYAARHAHALGCFSFNLYLYRDPALGAWVRRVAEILATEGEVERCQQRFLSSEELAVVGRQLAKDF